MNFPTIADEVQWLRRVVAEQVRLLDAESDRVIAERDRRIDLEIRVGRDREVSKRAAEYISGTDPFGDHFGEHDLDVLRGEAESKAALRLQLAREVDRAETEDLCSDCPPVGYPTDETRCNECPRLTWSQPRAL